MRYVGDLQVDSQIVFFMDDLIGEDQRVSDTYMSVLIEPSNATISFFLLDQMPQEQSWSFETNVAGAYRIRAERTVQPIGGAQFQDIEYYDFDISGEASGDQITQTHSLVYPTDGQCNHVGVLVETNVLMSEINGITLSPPTNSYTLDKNRYSDLSVYVVASDPTSGTNNTINTTKVNFMGPVAATGSYLDVTVNESSYAGFPYEYNFGDGYQSNNRYHYETAGEKTIYVRDTYGCVQSILHETNLLPEINPLDIPLNFYVSKGNSFRFVERVDFDNCGIYKTDENTLDCEVPLLDLDYTHLQRFKNCNDISTQIKATYDSYEVQIFDAVTNLIAYNVPVTLIQQNLNVLSQLPYNRLDDGEYSYIYFDDGNIPYYYEVGGGLTVNGELRGILGFVYNQDLDLTSVQILKLNVANEGTADYNYNRQPYNVYEFISPLATLPVGLYYTTLVATKGENTINYATDIWELNTAYDQTVDILYYCESNTDIYYGGGFKNFITFGVDSRAPVVSSELNVITGDKSNFLQKSFNVEKFTYTFEPLTLEMMRKLVYAMNNQYLFIDSVGYACESVDLEVPDPTTNLYVVVATLFKSNQNVTFLSGQRVEFDYSSSVVTFDSSISYDRTYYEN